MKLVREHINEKFEDKSDPIEDLGIGIRTFHNLKPGDIIECIKSSKKFTYGYTKDEFAKNGLFIVVNKKVVYSEFRPKEQLYIKVIPYAFRYNLNTYTYYNIMEIRDKIIHGNIPNELSHSVNVAHISVWEKHFQVLQKEDLLPPSNPM